MMAEGAMDRLDKIDELRDIEDILYKRGQQEIDQSTYGVDTEFSGKPKSSKFERSSRQLGKK